MSGQGGEWPAGADIHDTEAVASGNRDALVAMLPGAVAAEVLEAIWGAQASSGHSPKVGELVKALCRARANFGEVLKDRTATIPGKDGKRGYDYAYATLASAFTATTDALAEQELVAFHDFVQEDGQVRVTARIVHSSEQFITNSLALDTPRGVGAQVLGGLLTYLRRYTYFGLLGLAPTDDDDGGHVQQLAEDARPEQVPALSVEELSGLVAADPSAAFAAVRKLVSSAVGCGDISEPRLKRLYSLADRERGWSRDVLDATCAKLLGVTAAKIPWKAYESVVELFSKAAPAAVLAPAQQAPQSAPRPAPVPPTATMAQQEAVPALPWREVWDRIGNDFRALSAAAQADPLDKGSVPAVLEAFGRSGWAPEQVRAVLRAELKIEAEEMPKDGTHPPVYRKIARAFRDYAPADVAAADRQKYGWEPTIHEEEPPFGDPEGEPVAGSSSEIMGAEMERLAGPLPATADEAWQAVRRAVDAIGAASPNALVPTTPEDRMTLFKKSENGNRSSGDVDALCRYYLGVRVESLPAVVFGPVVRLLQVFPVRWSGREEVLGRLPKNPAKMTPKDLRDVVLKMVQDGVIQEDEVPRSGENGKATKEDLLKALEMVRDRALLEAGRA